MTELEIIAFSNLFHRAAERMKGIIIIGEYRSESIGFFNKVKINKSIKELEECLSMIPDHWQSIVFLAKAHQRIGNHLVSLELLEKALEIEKYNHTIPQEASLECLHLENIEKALIYSAEANRRKPDDIVLLGNHAMNLLIASKDKEAKDTIDRAIELDSGDQLNLNIKKVIEDVINGKCQRPTFKTVI